MGVAIKFRKGTAAEHASFAGLAAEVTEDALVLISSFPSDLLVIFCAKILIAETY